MIFNYVIIKLLAKLFYITNLTTNINHEKDDLETTSAYKEIKTIKYILNIN